MKQKVIAEYVTQVIEDFPGNVLHKKSDKIIRCEHCAHFIVPTSNYEDVWCNRLFTSTSPNGYCCWAEEK